MEGTKIHPRLVSEMGESGLQLILKMHFLLYIIYQRSKEKPEIMKRWVNINVSFRFLFKWKYSRRRIFNYFNYSRWADLFIPSFLSGILILLNLLQSSFNLPHIFEDKSENMVLWVNIKFFIHCWFKSLNFTRF